MASQVRRAPDRPRIAYNPYRKPAGVLAERMRRVARLETRFPEAAARIERSQQRFAARPVARQASRRVRQSYRAYANRSAPEAAGYTRVTRVDPFDGHTYPAMVPRRRLAGWGGLLEESRANRIAQARAAGFLVMRSRTFEFPDGRRMHSLRPLGDDFDDPY